MYNELQILLSSSLINYKLCENNCLIQLIKDFAKIKRQADRYINHAH